VVNVPLGLLVAGAAGIGSGLWWAYRRGSNSKREDVPPVDNPHLDATGMLYESIGWPYFWAKGSPATPWESGPDGVDCSGYAQMALVRLGLLSPGYSDRGARSLADDSDPVVVGSQRPGDLAYYGGHVMVVLSQPGADGHSAVIGASGGDGTTFGNDENARVKVYDSALYSGNFVTYMRLKAGKA
jgi:hypothetical protein